MSSDEQEAPIRVSVTELAGAGGVAADAGVRVLSGHGRLLLGQQVHERFRATFCKTCPGYRAEVRLLWRGEVRGRAVIVEGRADGLYLEPDVAGKSRGGAGAAGSGVGPRAEGESGGDCGSWVVQEIKSILAPDLGWCGAGTEAAVGTAAEAAGGRGVERGTQLVLEDLLEDLPDPLLESYRWQCALYVHLLALGAADPVPADRLRGELVLVDARSLAHQVLPVPYEPEACEAFLAERLEALLAERVEQERLARRRRAFAAGVTFPHAQPRPGQQALMENVGGAAESGLGLLVSAPTGIGKTVAAIVPMLRAALAANRRLLVVTAKVSQQELALDTLAELVPRGSEIRVAQMEARERSCPAQEMLCTVHACPLLRASLAPDAMAPLRERFSPGGVWRAHALRRLAAEQGLCPFEVSLAAAAQADVLVGDFNYAVHPRARLERFVSQTDRERVLLVDEAHNLPDRARDFLSPTLSRRRVQELAEGALHGGHPVFAGITEFLLRVLCLIDEAEAEAAAGPQAHRATAQIELDPTRLEALGAEAEAWLMDYLAWAKSGARRPAAFVPRTAPGSRRVVDPFVGFSYDLLHFVEAAGQRGDHMAHLVHRRPGDEVQREVTLQVFCKDPSRYLAARFRQFHAVVAMSATLEPLGFFADELGLSRLRTHEACVFPSPFPPENRCLVIDTSVSTRFRERERDLPEVCRRIGRIAALRPGNYLAFFPSYAVAETAALLIQASGAPVRVVRQRPGQGAGPLLREFEQAAAARRGRGGSQEPGGARGARRSPAQSLVGVAVIGGALSEGVDFVGALAQGVFVVGPGLPAVTDERRIMQDYFEHHHPGLGFEYAYLYPGLARVVQAAGRVIRGPTEQGVIVLVGQRFAEPRYRELLPGFWQEEVVVTEDPEEVVARFWRGRPVGA